jgi:processive 1,2-diacylglycerol beta-glucosyltransferase
MGTFVFERPWAQPEVDLFLSFPGEVAAQLRRLGVPAEKIVECGVPVDPAFGSSPNRSSVRARLGLHPDLPVLLVNFGGSGKSKPREVVSALYRIHRPFQAVFLARRDEKLRGELLDLSANMPHARVLSWVDNVHEWMAVADLLLSRAGGGIVAESMNCGLPILVFDAPPGNERRICELIEKSWHTGYHLESPGAMADRIDYLFAERKELGRLCANAWQRSHPHASRDGALAILQRLDQRNRPNECHLN